MELRGDEIPPEVAAVLEEAAYALGVRHGRWTIELFLQDGRIRKWRREEEGGRDDLRRFERREDTP